MQTAIYSHPTANTFGLLARMAFEDFQDKNAENHADANCELAGCRYYAAIAEKEQSDCEYRVSVNFDGCR